MNGIDRALTRLQTGEGLVRINLLNYSLSLTGSC
jgi:hypothetical protein